MIFGPVCRTEYGTERHQNLGEKSLNVLIGEQLSDSRVDNTCQGNEGNTESKEAHPPQDTPNSCLVCRSRKHAKKMSFKLQESISKFTHKETQKRFILQSNLY